MAGRQRPAPRAATLCAQSLGDHRFFRLRAGRGVEPIWSATQRSRIATEWRSAAIRQSAVTDHRSKTDGSMGNFGPLYKQSFPEDQRDGDPAQVPRTKHIDHLHQVSAAARRPTNEDSSQIASGDRGMNDAARRRACARMPCAITNLAARPIQYGRQKRAKQQF
jgi:hypothetical protein